MKALAILFLLAACAEVPLDHVDVDVRAAQIDCLNENGLLAAVRVRPDGTVVARVCLHPKPDAET